MICSMRVLPSPSRKYILLVSGEIKLSFSSRDVRRNQGIIIDMPLSMAKFYYLGIIRYKSI
jgi:hypothetical protein